MVAEALVWLVAERLDGLRHDVVTMPKVPEPERLHSLSELLSDTAPPLPMRNNIDMLQ
ncbi:hypothetical protein ACFVH6_42650 [Spirillospora sp. NPDC127200]